MSRRGESPKDKVYADCENMGKDKVREHVEAGTHFSGIDLGHARRWLGESDQNKQAISIARRANEIAEENKTIACCALILSGFSFIVACAAIFM